MQRVAGSFLKSTLVGVVDPDAWNCMPAMVLEEMLTTETLMTCRAEVPVGLWTGFVKMFKPDDDVWFCTKGFHRWGVMDFAYLGKHSQADETFRLFNGLFNYVRRSKAKLKPGDTAEFGELFVRFEQVSEYKDYLEGPLGTLVVRSKPVGKGH